MKILKLKIFKSTIAVLFAYGVIIVFGSCLDNAKANPLETCVSLQSTSSTDVNGYASPYPTK